MIVGKYLFDDVYELITALINLINNPSKFTLWLSIQSNLKGKLMS